jgi:hypothetical protein
MMWPSSPTYPQNAVNMFCTLSRAALRASGVPVLDGEHDKLFSQNVKRENLGGTSAHRGRASARNCTKKKQNIFTAKGAKRKSKASLRDCGVLRGSFFSF